MLTVSAAKAPAGDAWIHEWKWDGYRLLGQSGPDPVTVENTPGSGALPNEFPPDGANI